MNRGKAVGTGVAAALAIYFLIVPMFWWLSEPAASVTIPSAWRHDVDVPIHVRVTNPHPNFVIQEVRVTFDYAPGDGQGTPYPRILHQAAKKQDWPTFTLNRFTWPCSSDLDVTLPLAELARDSGVKAGVLKGQVQVTVDYVRATGRSHARMGRLSNSSVMIATPYELALD
ncbi:MAG: hypothetical protein K1Y02_24700 [Candidatus Hydrogenedentes bacterium]|nr:hypothetical protein [Candidatus Hydrogenedentota bacterium]